MVRCKRLFGFFSIIASASAYAIDPMSAWSLDTQWSARGPRTQLTLILASKEPAVLKEQLSPQLPVTMTPQGTQIVLKDYAPLSRDVHPSDLTATFVIDFDEPIFKTLKKEVLKENKSPGWLTLRDFVGSYLTDKNMKSGFDLASQVAQSKSGDCTEHAVLYAAVARMFKVPARVILGIVFIRSPVTGTIMHFGHAWNEVHEKNTWKLVDATGIGQAKQNEGLETYYLPLLRLEDESPAYASGMFKFLTFKIDKIIVPKQ